MSLSYATRIGPDSKVRKRNGQLVAFNPVRIEHAIANAFKQIQGIPREVDLSQDVSATVHQVTEKVLHVINARMQKQEALSVEEVQDEVIRQLYENGHPAVGECYANYRKEQAARRAVMEKYSTVKRDGRIVSFKPEKITLAVARAVAATRDKAVGEDILYMAEDITQAVMSDIRQQWPDGWQVSIETIQDLVEKNLMASAQYDVVKRYILYREEHSRARQQADQEPLDVGFDWVRNLQVIGSDGRRRPLNPEDLRFTIHSCCQDLTEVDPEKILQESVKNYFDGIDEEQVAASNIMAAKAFLEKEPQYTFLAARLLLLKSYREALGREVSFEGIRAEYPTYFVQYIKQAVELELLSPELLDFDLPYLGNKLDAKRDFGFRYMGLQTLYDRYFLHWDGRRLELPQVFWMRVAMGLAKTEPQDKERRAVEFYEMLSTFRFMSSTPTLFNSGTRHSQLSSCFLTTVSDDLFHIFKCVQDDAMLSKWSGGLGNDWTSIRSMGARIKGTNGKSQGVIPFLKVANDTALAVNQGGKRQGAMCAYLEVWHLDIEEFMELRKNTGDDRRRTHDMHTANWIPDLFMKRVKENGEWTLFSPNEVPDLHDLYGQAFERRYTEYEQQARDGKIKQYKVVSAVQIWRRMLSMLFETGHPWITWKDPSNVRSPQDHVGVVHSSNLCTEILLNTSAEETAVCNLGSINLAAHTTATGLDMDKLRETVHTAVHMLDNVIDNNFYPTKEARTANQRHRPIGLGLMGFQDALFIQNIGYASPAAVDFADRSMEAISFFAIEGSIALARSRGAYSTYQGSKWDRGMLPLDTLELLKKERGGFLDVDMSSNLDWVPLRSALKRHGMRNSLVMAIAPTATIANIVGVTSSIEPLYKNIFVKSNLSGEFTVLNEYLVNDLKSLGLWDAEMIDDLKYFDGSIQEIDRIPDAIKQKYATAFEIDYEWIIEAGSRRQKWIDMGQSLNLYQARPSGKKVHDMYMFAWEKGLKTTYYLRSMGATRIEKSTIDITKAKYADNIVGRRDRDAKGRVIAQAAASGELSVEPTEDCEACQ